jgi:8-oxo-dGTP pyrophosphatase MutT (NUDIX family)
MTNNYNYDKSYDVKKKKKIIFCSNCGKIGHSFRKCKDPITSIGIINVKIPNFQLIKNEIDNLNNDNINILSHNNQNFDEIIRNANKYKNQIKFLLVRRKHNLSYIEFIRGRYEVEDIKSIISLFELMSPIEINKITTLSFDDLWTDLWKKTSGFDIYKKEYVVSKEKFLKLKNNENQFNLDVIIKNVKPLYEFPEWGFPKGRRNKKEKNMDCAIREFYEETNLLNDQYKLINCISPVEEIFFGTNKIQYKHSYYLSLDKTDNNTITISCNNSHQQDEIGDIGWFTYEDAINKIRPYHEEKKKLLNEIYLFFCYLLDKSSKNVNVLSENYV